MPEKISVPVMIGDQPIPWSFVMWVHNQCSKDWDYTIDCFWKARNAIGQDAIRRYIVKGLKPDSQGRKWMLNKSKEHQRGETDMLHDWWLSLYDRKKAKSGAAHDIMQALLQSIGGIG